MCTLTQKYIPSFVSDRGEAIILLHSSLNEFLKKKNTFSNFFGNQEFLLILFIFYSFADLQKVGDLKNSKTKLVQNSTRSSAIKIQTGD